MYEQVKANHMFIVKTDIGSFNAVAPDLKLEQTKCICFWGGTCSS